MSKEGTYDMNFQNLTYFLTAAQERNLTRAAERLHISQQALSNHIARLEEELDCQLFERRAGLELTYAGRVFLRSVEQMLDIRRQTAAAIEDIKKNRRGELRIGVSHTRGQAILPLLLPRFSRLYPHAELSIVEGSSRELEKELERGEIDVLIGFAPFLIEGAQCVELMQERLFLVAPKQLLAERFGAQAQALCAAYREAPDLRVFRSLPFVLLTKSDRIRALVDQEFARCGIRPDIIIETKNVQTAFALAAEGMGLTVCPELYLNCRYTAGGDPASYTRQKVEILPLFPGTDTIAIGYHRERYLSRMAKDFIDMSVRTFHPEPAQEEPSR